MNLAGPYMGIVCCYAVVYFMIIDCNHLVSSESFPQLKKQEFQFVFSTKNHRSYIEREKLRQTSRVV